MCSLAAFQGCVPILLFQARHHARSMARESSCEWCTGGGLDRRADLTLRTGSPCRHPPDRGAPSSCSRGQGGSGT